MPIVVLSSYLTILCCGWVLSSYTMDCFRYDANRKLSLYGTEVYRPGNEILKFTKREQDKLKNKLG